MKAGISKVDITPPVGVDLSGFVGRVQPSVGIHDDLYATALVLDDGDKKVAIVTCHLVGLAKDSVKAIRQLIFQRTGIPEENVMVCCTHTHSGPATWRLRYCGQVDEPWMSVFCRQVAGAVMMAERNLTEARIGFGQGTVRIGINRRIKREPQEYSPPESPEPGVDSSLSVLKVKDSDGRLIAAVLNYACHPVVMAEGNRLISADFPGAAVRFVEQALPEKPVVLYANGACGDINPYVRGGTFEDVNRLGAILGAEAIKVLNLTKTVSDLTLDVASKEVTLPLEVQTRQEVEDKLDSHRRKFSEGGYDYSRGSDKDYLNRRIYKAMEQWATETLNLIDKGSPPRSLSSEVQAIRIGELCVVGLPGEIFSQIGLSIKRRSPMRSVVFGYANDVTGYVPTQKAFEEGGYEVEEAYKYYSNFMIAPESVQILEDAAVSVVESLRENG